MTFVFLAIGFLPLNVYSIEDNPSACDCKTLVISDQEEQGGCPASVKRETCALFRDSEQWQKRLQKEQELREMEKRIGTGRSSAILHK